LLVGSRIGVENCGKEWGGCRQEVWHWRLYWFRLRNERVHSTSFYDMDGLGPRPATTLRAMKVETVFAKAPPTRPIRVVLSTRRKVHDVVGEDDDMDGPCLGREGSLHFYVYHIFTA